MLNPIDELTVQGYDVQFGTNVLGTQGHVPPLSDLTVRQVITTSPLSFFPLSLPEQRLPLTVKPELSIHRLLRQCLLAISTSKR